MTAPPQAPLGGRRQGRQHDTVRLRQLELRLRQELRANAVARIRLVEAFEREYAELDRAAAAINAQLAEVNRQAAADQRLRDALAMPLTMRRWGRVIERLAGTSRSAATFGLHAPATSAIAAEPALTFEGVWVAPPSSADRAAFHATLTRLDELGPSAQRALTGGSGGGGGGGGGHIASARVQPAPAPCAAAVALASVPVAAVAERSEEAAAAASRVRCRGVLTDFAVLRSADAGRVVAAVRRHERGALLFEEEALVSVPVGGSGEAGAAAAVVVCAVVRAGLPPELQAALDRLLAQHAVFAAHPQWNPELIAAVFEVLRELGAAPTASARHAVRDVVLRHLCAPLDAIDAPQLNAISDLAHFVFAALPPALKRRHSDGSRGEEEDEEEEDRQGGALSEEDVAAVMVAYMCNSVSTTALSGGSGRSSVGREGGGDGSVAATAAIRCLFGFASLLEHSSRPNSSICFCYGSTGLRPRIRVVALRPIAAGERLSIAYVNTFAPLAHIQQRLQAAYFFTDLEAAAGAIVDAARAFVVVGGSGGGERWCAAIAPIGADGGRWAWAAASSSASPFTARRGATTFSATAPPALRAVAAERAWLEATAAAAKAWREADVLASIRMTSEARCAGGRLPELTAALRALRALIAAPDESAASPAGAATAPPPPLLPWWLRCAEACDVLDVDESAVGGGGVQRAKQLLLTELRELHAVAAAAAAVPPLLPALLGGVPGSGEAAADPGLAEEGGSTRPAVRLHVAHYAVLLRLKQVEQCALALTRGVELHLPAASVLALLVIAVRVADAVLLRATSEYIGGFAERVAEGAGGGGDELRSDLAGRVAGCEANAAFLAALWELHATLCTDLARTLQNHHREGPREEKEEVEEEEEEEEEELAREVQVRQSLRDVGGFVAEAHATRAWHATALLYGRVLGWREHPRCVAAQLRILSPLTSGWPDGPTDLAL